jgi:predicted RNA-binding protein YlqC (UPF0109 family)
MKLEPGSWVHTRIVRVRLALAENGRLAEPTSRDGTLINARRTLVSGAVVAGNIRVTTARDHT